MMYCSRCGKEISDDSRYCPYCGMMIDKERKGKSQIAAGLLGIFLGSLGIHNFYLGYMTKGTIQLLLTVLGGLFFDFAPIISGIWAFVEAILIFMGRIDDASGNPLS